MIGIFKALVNAISKISVLFGGNEVTVDSDIFDGVINWLKEVGITFVD